MNGLSSAGNCRDAACDTRARRNRPRLNWSAASLARSKRSVRCRAAAFTRTPSARTFFNPAFTRWACVSTRLPQTSPNAPTTHRNSRRFHQCNAISQTASWDVCGSRLLDNVSEIRRLFTRSAQVTGNLQKRLPSRGRDPVGLASEATLHGKTSTSTNKSPLFLHKRFQSRQSFVPLLGNALEIRLKLSERFRSELE